MKLSSALPILLYKRQLPVTTINKKAKKMMAISNFVEKSAKEVRLKYGEEDRSADNDDDDDEDIVSDESEDDNEEQVQLDNSMVSCVFFFVFF